MADADQGQAVVIDAEHFVVVEIDAVDIGFDDVIAHHLAEAQQAVLVAQGEQVLEQARPMMRGELAHQHGGSRRALRRFGLVDVVLGDDADGLAQFERVHDSVSFQCQPGGRRIMRRGADGTPCPRKRVCLRVVQCIMLF